MKWDEMRTEKMRADWKEELLLWLNQWQVDWKKRDEVPNLLGVLIAALRDDLRSIWIAKIEGKASSQACVSTSCPVGQ